MKNLQKNILDAIGNTPIIKLNKIIPKTIKSEIYVKLEYMNPGGSIKDRIGKYILEEAKRKGELKEGGIIIEGTSGNTGVGLAMYASIHGHKTIFVLADKQSKEKIENLRAFGAKVIVCPTNVAPEDPRSYYSVSQRLADQIPNSYFVNQYHNTYNRETHYHNTGPEILAQTEGDFDVFMAGVGTGGTISGIGKYLKEKMPNLKVVAVDIEGSILAHYHKTGEMSEPHPYVLEGIGEDIIPGNLDFSLIDDFVVVDDKESFLTTRALLTNEGIYAGGSSGAAIMGAIKYAQSLKTPQKILVILPDSGNRYSSKIYNDDWMRENGYNDSTFNVNVANVLETLNKNYERKFISIEDTASVQDAVTIMEKYGISQLPILSRGEVIGITTEKKLLRPLYEGKINLSDSVSLIIENNYVEIDNQQFLEDITKALSNKKIPLIKKDGVIIDILTNIDVLNYINLQSKYL